MAVDSTRALLTPSVAHQPPQPPSGASAGRIRPHAAGALGCALAVLGLLAACATGPTRPPAGLPDPDRFLFEQGTEKLNNRDWFTAREYFRQLVDSYPQSQYRAHAKLGIGDTFIGEGTAEAFVLGINEFREFLSLYPVHERADYAQFKLGMAHYYQMRGPMRDQTETLEAIRELTTFLERYPPRGQEHPLHGTRQELIAEGRERLREARDRIGEHELGVGVQYHRTRWYPGAIERLRGLLDKDPEFGRRDAALFYLADSYDKLGRPAEALPYYDRLLKEFEQSEFLERARLRWTAIRETMEQEPAGISDASVESGGA